MIFRFFSTLGEICVINCGITCRNRYVRPDFSRLRYAQPRPFYCLGNTPSSASGIWHLPSCFGLKFALQTHHYVPIRRHFMRTRRLQPRKHFICPNTSLKKDKMMYLYQFPENLFDFLLFSTKKWPSEHPPLQGPSTIKWDLRCNFLVICYECLKGKTSRVKI